MACQDIELAPPTHGTTGMGMTTLARQFTGGVEVVEATNPLAGEPSTNERRNLRHPVQPTAN
ncbi:pyruvate carboxylase [Streptomyces sp. TE3672]